MWTKIRLPIVLALGAAVAIWSLHAAVSGGGAKASAAQAPRTASASPSAASSGQPSASGKSSASGKPSATVSTPASTKSVEQAKGKVVYLTFDDGPDPRWTPEVLAVLAKHNVHGTFFMLAEHADAHPDLVDEVRTAGNAIGNHSVSHPQLTKLSPARLHEQVANGIQSKCFRPPYGATNPRVKAEIKRDGMQQVLWDVDTNDWKRPGATTIANRVVAGARPGAIILMHDGGGNRSQTVAGLDQALTKLSARGYGFATLSC
ncbi:polysaccharide deacetylase family protein [Kribbella solani]|uniref:polysaccharide deacetylase family protein n=1 Tax=Kribbella solani TaxID=236067 RepID=UPI0029A7D1E0|nr:polysaccharide deacetylase family protein [Kribbella solani]MDX3002402.1 polysaccharide deacetylase family protein [Kribbella solani]